MSSITNFVDAAKNLAASVSAASPSPKEAIEALSEMANFYPNETTNLPKGLDIAASAMQQAMGDVLRRTALIELARQIARYQPSSYDDAVCLKIRACTLLDREISIAADQGEDKTYLAFRQLKAAVVNDLTRRGGNLANIRTVSTAQSMPASALAHTLYQDAGRTDQLVRQANPKHPAFMPNDFDALSINTPARQAAFLAQIGHESGQLSSVAENLNYSAERLAAVWPTRYRTNGKPNALAMQIARNPQAIANNTYANRMGNGSVASGDGWKYRGRGLIQVTGKAGYQAAGRLLGLQLETSPELLEQPDNAALSAAAFWASNNLNALADAGDMRQITKIINGGYNGLVGRMALFDRAKRVLK